VPQDQPAIVVRHPEAIERTDGALRIFRVQKNRLRRQQLHLEVIGKSPCHLLDQTSGLRGSSPLPVELRLMVEAGEEKTAHVLGLPGANVHTSRVGVHELSSVLARLVEEEETQEADGARKKMRGPRLSSPREEERQDQTISEMKVRRSMKDAPRFEGGRQKDNHPRKRTGEKPRQYPRLLQTKSRAEVLLLASPPDGNPAAVQSDGNEGGNGGGNEGETAQLRGSWTST
jgi:hypothetical protein